MQQKERTIFENNNIDAIRQIPSESCSSCNKFLFPSEALVLDQLNPLVPNLSVGDAVCNLCKSYISTDRMPYGYVRGNSLNVPDQPPELLNLSVVDKRFISKLHTFMTLLVLPRGGQYAQKGMAIHFEAPIQEIVNDFSFINTANGFIPVINAHKETSIQYMNYEKVVHALQWLKIE